MDKHDLKANSVLNVTIKLIDINDQPPIFSSNLYTAGISSSSKTFNTTLQTTLMADDADEGDNAVFVFKMVGKVQRQGENLEKIQDPLFIVDGDSGKITVNFAADKTMLGYFWFAVQAVDKANNSDHANVSIYLMRDDMHVLLHVQMKRDNINDKFLDAFSGIMRSVTNHAFNVDNCVDYSGERKDLIGLCSTIWGHFVNVDTNQILDPKEALKIINQNYAELVAQTGRIGGQLFGAQEKSEEPPAPEEDHLMYFLLGGIGALSLVLTVTCGIFCYKLKSNTRKLQAATASTYATSDELKAEIALDVAPNTNAHAMQGSNPIWKESELNGELPITNAFTFGQDFDSISDVSGLDFRSQSHPPSYVDDEDDILDGAVNAGLEVDDEDDEDADDDTSSARDIPKPALTKFDTISNLKRAEEQWREKKQQKTKGPAPPPPGTQNPFQFQTVRKNKDYIPGLEDESDL